MNTDQYGGMTVNERLAATGRLRAWDRAVHARDRDQAIAVLVASGLSAESAEGTVDAVLANPARYGFRS